MKDSALTVTIHETVFHATVWHPPSDHVCPRFGLASRGVLPRSCRAHSRQHRAGRRAAHGSHREARMS